MRMDQRNRRLQRYAWCLLIVLLIDMFTPTVSWALTSGPSQPEVQSFEPASTTQMVDLFTGDFTYNIPLFELPGPNGGYPFNLAYHAGIGMDQEASWVGLGWSLNPGAINRQMRGLPDEFKGDEVVTKQSMKPSRTIGVGAGVSAEVFGFLGVGTDRSLFYNNYKGVGMEIGTSLSFAVAVSGDYSAGLGLGFSANSQEGVGLNPSLSISRKFKESSGAGGSASSSGSIFIGAGYNSRVGLTGISVGTSHSVSATKTRTKDGEEQSSTISSTKHTSSSSISLFNPGFTPAVGTPMVNKSINLSVEVGGSFWGVYPNFRFSGFYNEQKLRDDNKNVRTPAYGYLHYQDAEEPEALLDFNREGEGVVREENPNLPVPGLTYDVYAASGQGYSAMYRPMRADIGTIHDPYRKSVSQGLSIGGDVGPPFHIGINATVNHAVSESGKWESDNEVKNLYDFQQKEKNDLYEPVYFKVHGEHTMSSYEQSEDIGGEEAVMLKLGGKSSSPKVTKTLSKDKHTSWSKTAKGPDSYGEERMPRNSLIEPMTNGQLKKSNGEEVIDLFKVHYVNASGVETKYQRTYPDHHLAGFTALTPEGSRYVYALPAYNTRHEEVSYSSSAVTNDTRASVSPQNSNGDPNFSVSGTNEYFDKKIIPEYAHSYLLTAIVGQDYVDVTGDGVTADDLGYWVKFTYHQAHSKNAPYKWRAPFYKANYFAGFKTTREDDRATYQYGEKEIWYLNRVETKSHIAEFKTSTREDGRGARYRLQNNNQLGASLNKLDEIVMYTRFGGEGTPLKRVKFDYSYALCQGVENAPANTGKLTLKQVHFEYGTSSRGRLNPYVFDYHEDSSQENPDYDLQAYDRWGHFKPNTGADKLKNQEYPYVDQSAPKTAHDLRAGVWSLKEVDLPSGGHMVIDYESDDYAYVQNREAMQMLELIHPATKASSNFELSDSDLKMFFKLPVPIEEKEGVSSEEAAAALFESDRDLLYFKLKANLRSPNEDVFEWLTSYATLDRSVPPYLVKGAGDSYEYGCFTLKKEMGHHPLSVRAWQHLRVNQPDLASVAGKVDLSDDESGLIKTLKGLASIIPQVQQFVSGFYDYADNRSWGRELQGGKCWVRLVVPDKTKYGGGHRVRQITFKDNWSEDDEGVYGQVYTYRTTDDRSGATYSSGVAAYEPIIGGDENPMRYAKQYTQSIPLQSNNTLFFEYPVNEGYFPAAQVGYSKVSVMSVASAAAAGEAVLHTELGNGRTLFPTKEEGSYGVTGKTVHEYYTAREFPVVTDETVKENKTDKLWIPAIPLGTISAKRLASTQGYSIVTNDMHGKQKKVSQYGQSPEGEFAADALSYVKYNYMTESDRRDGKSLLKPYNVFSDNGDGTVSKVVPGQAVQGTRYHMGQEVELFADMRHHSDKSYYGGASNNVDVIVIPLLFVPVPIPVPTIWPSVGKDEKTLKTVVMNKVVFKSGILDNVEVHNEGSTLLTRHLKWDKLTGRPVLSVVNNNFDAPVYTQEIPAHAIYDGLGPAYETANYQFEVDSLYAIDGLDGYYEVNLKYHTRQTLFEGDELVLMDEAQMPQGTAVYLGRVGSKYRVFSKDALANASYTGMVYRSGKRNLLTANAGQVTALKDPTTSTESKTYTIDLLTND